MQKQVLHNQSVLDVLLQHTGGLSKLPVFILSSNISVTDDLTTGQEYELPGIDDEEIYNYFSAKNIIPATSVSTADFEQINPTLGIGTMVIGSTFIIG